MKLSDTTTPNVIARYDKRLSDDELPTRVGPASKWFFTTSSLTRCTR